LKVDFPSEKANHQFQRDLRRLDVKDGIFFPVQIRSQNFIKIAETDCKKIKMRERGNIFNLVLQTR
jgi:hypothetical protein